MNIHIREAVTADYFQLLHIYRELDERHRKAHPDLFKEPDGERRPFHHLQKLIYDKYCYLCVAERDGTLAGLAEACVRKSEPFPVLKTRGFVQLDNIAVLEDYQGQGIGKRLFSAVCNWALEKHNIHRAELKVFHFNTSARIFYEKEGFKPLYETLYLDF